MQVMLTRTTINKEIMDLIIVLSIIVHVIYMLLKTGIVINHVVTIYKRNLKIGISREIRERNAMHNNIIRARRGRNYHRMYANHGF